MGIFRFGCQPDAGEIAETFNATMEQLNAFSSEVLRIMRELGVDGKFGGQAEVDNLSGTWEQMRDAVNVTAANLTNQVRNFSEVAHRLYINGPSVTATVPAEGEMALLKSTLNCLVMRYTPAKEKA